MKAANVNIFKTINRGFNSGFKVSGLFGLNVAMDGKMF